MSPQDPGSNYGEIPPRPAFHRRGFLLGAVGLGALGTLGVLQWPDRGLVYRDLPSLPPFRELVSGGAVSTGSLAFVSLRDGEDDPALLARVTEVRAAPCEMLFGQVPFGGTLSIAYFSDFNCPYCRVLETDLDRVLKADSDLRLVRHELPLLGGASASAARAVLAADLQGRYDELKARLLRAGLITDEPYLRAVTPALGIDPDRLVRDMTSPLVMDRLLTSQALGQAFGIAGSRDRGIAGTPALVIGRTLIMGAVSTRTVERVVRDERARGDPPCQEGEGPSLDDQSGSAAER